MPEIPGRMKGTFKDGNKTIQLEGDCKIVQQRQPSKLGHNSLKIDFIKPPKGIGVTADFEFNYLKKKGFTKLEFTPRPRFSFEIGKTSNFKNNKKKK